MKELALTEFRIFLREPIALFFTFLFPILLLLILGVAYGDLPSESGFRTIDFIIPMIIAMLVGYLGLMAIPIVISEYREQGVLNRYRVSPLPLRNFLLVRIIVEFTLLLIASLLVTIVGEGVFNARFVGNPGLVLVGILISGMSMFTIGLVLAGFFPSPRTAQALGGFLFFTMLFTSGAAIPRQQFPIWFQELTDYVPLTYVVDMLKGLWVGKPLRDQLIPLIVLLGIAAIAFLLVVLIYRLKKFE